MVGGGGGGGGGGGQAMVRALINSSLRSEAWAQQYFNIVVFIICRFTSFTCLSLLFNFDGLFNSNWPGQDYSKYF